MAFVKFSNRVTGMTPIAFGFPEFLFFRFFKNRTLFLSGAVRGEFGNEAAFIGLQPVVFVL